MQKLQELLQEVVDITNKNLLVKITIGKKRNNSSDLKNVFIKPILIKNNLMLSFTFRYPTKDITKNFSVEEIVPAIQKIMEEDFYNLDMYTTTKVIYYTSNNNNQEKIIKKDTERTTPVLTHDKQKQRLLNPNAFYLHALGITTSDGQVKKDMQHKYKQINRYVEIIEGILKDEILDDNFSVVDMGSGKGYLTFALYDFLKEKNKKIKVEGIELRPDLIDTCNQIAAQSKFENLSFTKGSIEETPLHKVNMLIALHACDTATDDAILKGIKANAPYIICAPCCHKQIRKQMNPTNVLSQITKHGILLERQAEMVTDTIRALILEAHGYKTKVFDFIEEEDTPKNVMIVAVKNKTNKNSFDENMKRVKELKALFGIEKHYLETII
jgi:SAM-dependent methyltransferase